MKRVILCKASCTLLPSGVCQPHVLWLSCELNANSSMLTFSMYTPVNTQRLDLFMDKTNGKLTTETSDQPEKREALFSFVF